MAMPMRAPGREGRTVELRIVVRDVEDGKPVVLSDKVLPLHELQVLELKLIRQSLAVAAGIDESKVNFVDMLSGLISVGSDVTLKEYGAMQLRNRLKKYKASIGANG